VLRAGGVAAAVAPVFAGARPGVRLPPDRLADRGGGVGAVRTGAGVGRVGVAGRLARRDRRRGRAGGGVPFRARRPGTAAAPAGAGAGRGAAQATAAEGAGGGAAVA